MTLSVAQQAVVKADILANSDLNVFPAGDDGAAGIAALYNLLGAQDGWSNSVDTLKILAGVDYTKYTPVDVIAAPAADALMLLSNKYFAYLQACGYINVKQMNLQNMTIGRNTIDCTDANIRNSLRDCVVNIPAGAANANISAAGANGVNVTAVMTRKLTRFENILASGTTTTGATTAKTPVFIGSVNYSDIRAARES